MIAVQGPDRLREEELNRLVLLYERDLLRLCCMYLRDVALAQDAVQETFLKAYRTYGTFRRDCAERTWLMRIAVNTCKDMRRSAWHRYINRCVTLDDLPLPAEEPGLEHIALTEAILQLPRKYMEVVVLHYYHGLNVKETALALEISSPAVTNRLKKAHAKLRWALEGGADDGKA